MYTYRIKKVNSVIDGDTIDCDIDLGFDVCLTQRIRLAGIDAPESRTRDLVEKKYGLEAKTYLENKLNTFSGQLIIRTEKISSTEKYGRILGWIFLGDENSLSVNQMMLNEGYAWVYNGVGEVVKDFSILESKRV